MTDEQRLELLNDFFAWSGGDLPTSPGQVIAYMKTSCPLPLTQGEETEAIEYLMSEIIDDSLFGQN
jgi:hypothetical protein